MEFGAFFAVDFKDWQNWVAVAIAIPLLWWGIKTIIAGLT